MVEKESPKAEKKNTFTTAMLAGGSVLLICTAFAALYFYNQYQHAQLLLKNPTVAAMQQTQALTAQVGKLIDLPTDEQPTIATVSDITKLKDQPCFLHAKNGDKVLIYTKARKAILFDPIANKIVEVAPVNIGNNTPVISPAVSVVPSPKSTETKTIPTKSAPKETVTP